MIITIIMIFWTSTEDNFLFVSRFLKEVMRNMCECESKSVKVRTVSRFDDPLGTWIDGVEGRHVCFMR